MPLTDLPAPGSAEAVERGCRCVLAYSSHLSGTDAYLRVTFGAHLPAYRWYTTGCPLHDAEDEDDG